MSMKPPPPRSPREDEPKKQHAASSVKKMAQRFEALAKETNIAPQKKQKQIKKVESAKSSDKDATATKATTVATAATAASAAKTTTVVTAATDNQPSVKVTAATTTVVPPTIHTADLMELKTLQEQGTDPYKILGIADLNANDKKIAIEAITLRATQSPKESIASAYALLQTPEKKEFVDFILANPNALDTLLATRQDKTPSHSIAGGAKPPQKKSKRAKESSNIANVATSKATIRPGKKSNAAEPPVEKSQLILDKKTFKTLKENIALLHLKNMNEAKIKEILRGYKRAQLEEQGEQQEEQEKSEEDLKAYQEWRSTLNDQEKNSLIQALNNLSEISPSILDPTLDSQLKLALAAVQFESEFFKFKAMVLEKKALANLSPESVIATHKQIKAFTAKLKQTYPESLSTSVLAKVQDLTASFSEKYPLKDAVSQVVTQKTSDLQKTLDGKIPGMHDFDVDYKKKFEELYQDIKSLRNKPEDLNRLINKLENLKKASEFAQIVSIRLNEIKQIVSENEFPELATLFEQTEVQLKAVSLKIDAWSKLREETNQRIVEAVKSSLEQLQKDFEADMNAFNTLTDPEKIKEQGLKLWEKWISRGEQGSRLDNAVILRNTLMKNNPIDQGVKAEVEQLIKKLEDATRQFNIDVAQNIRPRYDKVTGKQTVPGRLDAIVAIQDAEKQFNERKKTQEKRGQQFKIETHIPYFAEEYYRELIRLQQGILADPIDAKTPAIAKVQQTLSNEISQKIKALEATYPAVKKISQAPTQEEILQITTNFLKEQITQLFVGLINQLFGGLEKIDMKVYHALKQDIKNILKEQYPINMMNKSIEFLIQNEKSIKTTKGGTAFYDNSLKTLKELRQSIPWLDIHRDEAIFFTDEFIKKARLLMQAKGLLANTKEFNDLKDKLEELDTILTGLKAKNPKITLAKLQRALKVTQLAAIKAKKAEGFFGNKKIVHIIKILEDDLYIQQAQAEVSKFLDDVFQPALDKFEHGMDSRFYGQFTIEALNIDGRPAAEALLKKIIQEQNYLNKAAKFLEPRLNHYRNIAKYNDSVPVKEIIAKLELYEERLKKLQSMKDDKVAELYAALESNITFEQHRQSANPNSNHLILEIRQEFLENLKQQISDQSVAVRQPLRAGEQVQPSGSTQQTGFSPIYAAARKETKVARDTAKAAAQVPRSSQSVNTQEDIQPDETPAPKGNKRKYS